MRLIDADEAKKFYKENLILQEKSHEIIVRTMIDAVPTAYSVDKVVEELEIERKTANNTYNSFNMDVDLGRVFGLEKAIEIVKQVGVSDDVCEWKYSDSEYYWESSCEHLHIFMSDGPKENEYDFCPYCGKKIKVVE